jgi:Glycosyltransferase family 9 (heptosyltransferase)/Tetratricopeptide repeat
MMSETIRQALDRAQAANAAKRHQEARGIIADVLANHPDHPDALCVLGGFAAQRGDQTVIPQLERCLAQTPNNPSALDYLAILYRHARRFEEAREVGAKAIRLAPTHVGILINHALLLADMEEFGRAQAVILRAIGIEPDHPLAHLVLAQILLQDGQYIAGFREYEWRNRLPNAEIVEPEGIPPWNGQRLPWRSRLLVCADQGFGDCFMWARYLPMLRNLPLGNVSLGCDTALLPVLSRVAGVDVAHNKYAKVGTPTAYCSLTSLSHLMGTTLESIPWNGPYLSADPARAAEWHAKLPAGYRVGLVWAGRTTHDNDYRRSIPLAALAPLLALEWPAFVSLQVPPQHVAGVECPTLRDFGDTAAVIANLDLVIAVDTGTAHLAAGMGKPVWLMLSQPCEWRWLTKRADSPWYPTMRLFRQRAAGDWTGVVADICSALQEHRAVPSTGARPSHLAA